MGSSVRQFRRAFGEGYEWPEAAPDAAGNGALMRIAPIVLPQLGRDDAGLLRDAAPAGPSLTTVGR